MGLLNGIGSALGGLFKDTPGGMSASDKLTLIGSALTDFGNGGSPEMTLQARKLISGSVGERQKEAAMQQFLGMFSGGQPSTQMIPGKAMQGPGADGDPVANSLPTPAPISVPTRTPGLTLDDPRLPVALALAKRGGLDPGTYLDLMKTRGEQKYEEGVQYRPYGSNNPAFIPKRLDGAQPVFGPNGDVGMAPIPGAADVAANMAGAVQGAQEAAKAPFVGPNAYNQQFGQTMGTVYQHPNGDGSTTPTLGRDMFGPGASGGGGGMGAGGGAGRTQTPGQAEAQKFDYTAGAQTIAGAGDARIKAQNTSRQYQQAFDDVLALDPNNLTGFKLGTAKILRSLGVNNPNLEQFTNTAEGYRMLTTQMVLPLAKELGSNPSNRDAKIIQDSMPGLRTPRQTAATMFAQQSALQNKEAARQDFFANYQGDPSKAAMQRAWSQSPESKKSIFQDPVFGRLTIDGHPAVVYKQKGNKTYGIYLPFKPDGSVNPSAQVFEAQ